MSFTARFTTPVVPPHGFNPSPSPPWDHIPNSISATDVKRIILCHSSSVNLANPIPYHFCVRPNGEVVTGVPTTRPAPHSARSTNNIPNWDRGPICAPLSTWPWDHNGNSIAISALGNYDASTPPHALVQSMILITADCLINFTNVIRNNLANTSNPGDDNTFIQVPGIGEVFRGRMAQSLNTEPGILGHWDAYGMRDLCPGQNLNHRQIAADAINLANRYEGLERLTNANRIIGCPIDLANNFAVTHMGSAMIANFTEFIEALDSWNGTFSSSQNPVLPEGSWEDTQTRQMLVNAGVITQNLATRISSSSFIARLVREFASWLPQ